MFMQDVRRKQWWYRCDQCGAETERRNDHDSASGLEGWHFDAYPGTDTHTCPACQARPKARESLMK